MERVVSFTSFEEERRTKPALAYWLSRPPEERIAEVERLRREYMTASGARAMYFHKDFADLMRTPPSSIFWPRAGFFSWGYFSSGGVR
jgi:hypothetical protein